MTALTLRLVVDRLTQARGDRTLFTDLSFSVTAGEVVILTGPNGAGKTTLIRTLAGLIQPLHGSVSLAGGAADQSVGEQAHYVGHNTAIKPSLTVAENAQFWLQYFGSPAGSDTVLDQLDLLGLASIPAGYLSAGQQRRLGLVRLLVAPRPVWLLDEPTVSLDAINRERVAGLIQTHIQAGGLVVAATHLPLGLADTRELSLAS
jgi:heme exporter protein A